MSFSCSRDQPCDVATHNVLPCVLWNCSDFSFPSHIFVTPFPPMVSAYRWLFAWFVKEKRSDLTSVFVEKVFGAFSELQTWSTQSWSRAILSYSARIPTSHLPKQEHVLTHVQ